MYILQYIYANQPLSKTHTAVIEFNETFNNVLNANAYLNKHKDILDNNDILTTLNKQMQDLEVMKDEMFSFKPKP